MTHTFQGTLEIDSRRGVIYFHLTKPSDAEKFGGVTVLRICSLPKDIPTDRPLDITHLYGTNWDAIRTPDKL